MQTLAFIRFIYKIINLVCKYLLLKIIKYKLKIK